MARSSFSATVTLDARNFQKNIEEYDKRVKRMIASEFIWAEAESVRYAKQNAPWTDDTGNARAGLFAKARPINGGESFELLLAGSVPYQIWLEVRWSGKYAIIMPTLNVVGAQMISHIADRIGRLQ